VILLDSMIGSTGGNPLHHYLHHILCVGRVGMTVVFIVVKSFCTRSDVGVHVMVQGLGIVQFDWPFCPRKSQQNFRFTVCPG
jgi:hypothetical protein